MKFFTRSLLAAALVCAPLFSPAIAQDSKAAAPAATTAAEKTLINFAAASMKNALDEVDAAYTAKTKTKIVASYAASSALAKQLEQGAPADVFISADIAWMKYAIEKKSVKESTKVDLLGNTIVLIAPKDSKIDKVEIKQGFDLAKLAGDGRIATGDVAAVPVGKYAKAALEKTTSALHKIVNARASQNPSDEAGQAPVRAPGGDPGSTSKKEKREVNASGSNGPREPTDHISPK